MLKNRLLPSQSRTAPNLLDCRCVERIAALAIPLHIRHTTAMRCTARNNICNAKELSSDTPITTRKGSCLKIPSQRRTPADLQLTYLMRRKRGTDMDLRESEQHNGSLVAVRRCRIQLRRGVT